MKNPTRNSNYVVSFCVAVLFLFCIHSSAYAMFQSGQEGVFIFPEDGGLQQFAYPNPVSPIELFFDEPLPMGDFDPIASGNYGLALIDEFGDFHSMPFIFLDVENPTASDSISIHAWQYFHDSGFEMFDVIYSVSDFTINIDVIIKDLHDGGGVFSQAFTGRGGKAEVGLLAEGSYTVNANIYLKPWDGSASVLYDVLDSISFDVGSSYDMSIDTVPIPEPATLLLLGLGGLVLRRKR